MTIFKKIFRTSISKRGTSGFSVTKLNENHLLAVFISTLAGQMATLSEVNTEGGHTLDEVLDYTHLISAVHNLRETASALTPVIASVDGRARKIFMINSTSQGGGVAEMMPR